MVCCFLGVLVKAKQKGYIDKLKPILQRMVEKGIYFTESGFRQKSSTKQQERKIEIALIKSHFSKRNFKSWKSDFFRLGDCPGNFQQGRRCTQSFNESMNLRSRRKRTWHLKESEIGRFTSSRFITTKALRRSCSSIRRYSFHLIDFG